MRCVSVLFCTMCCVVLSCIVLFYMCCVVLFNVLFCVKYCFPLFCVCVVWCDVSFCFV